MVVDDIEGEICAINARQLITSDDHLEFKRYAKTTLDAFLKILSDSRPEDKKRVGIAVNKLKRCISEKLASFEDNGNNSAVPSFDMTLPSVLREGHRHPLSILENKIVGCLRKLGFMQVDTNEVEDDWHNFTALNIPEYHPARDEQDTFFLENGKLLRTHTSNTQIRVLEQCSLPVRCFSIGRVYRNETISARSHCYFHQVECFYVDTHVSIKDLKTTLRGFVLSLLGSSVRMRIRPSFFPFTMPGVEVDISCLICDGEGCHICKNSGWLEICGGGMIDPGVFDNVRVDSGVYSGFAIGLGLERVSLLMTRADDIRLYSTNDLRFLTQFFV